MILSFQPGEFPMPRAATAKKVTDKSNPGGRAGQSKPSRRRKIESFQDDIAPRLEAARRDWLVEARAAAIKLGKRMKTVTIDDVREVCPLPAEYDGRAYGVVFNADIWTCVGYRKSTRKICHNRPISIWRLLDE